MKAVTEALSAVARGYRALPFVVRRIILVLAYSLLFMAGAFMHNRGAGDIADLCLIVGGIGAYWASGMWRMFKVIFFVVRFLGRN
ncbi:hypothetical protein BLA23254_07432 [Burkholderia lata]|uniref:Uncharacterized protein n=1 Tax=Burkholderia lata (strain ATCC 17760 / DSM 23089 / LMG 22485 / NCIMB 9086 / R18194 / 383) TaxID=482957 RepID=A0A6P2SMQ4_BURL3|nr:hypothetical protein [Burkholderia lata]VWC46914.1 hypothetical protein BLA23254_07432 [Burkholderia lata]